MKEIKITNVMVSRILKGLGELSKLNINNFDINYGITKLAKELLEVEVAYNLTKKALMDEHIPIDERGTYMIDGNNLYVYKSIENRNKYYQQIMELNNSVICITKFGIKASELKKINGLKADTMISINELIEDDLD